MAIKKTVDNVSEKNFVKIIKGSIIAVLITILLLVISSLVLTYTNISERMMTPIIIVITAISILIGSFISSIKIRKQGIVNGGMVGAIYIVTIYLLSSIVEKDFGFNIYSIIMIASGILAGCLGGIIGVNMRRG
jgi:putative membrane protein (TIGR04086 family)